MARKQSPAQKVAIKAIQDALGAGLDPSTIRENFADVNERTWRRYVAQARDGAGVKFAKVGDVLPSTIKQVKPPDGWTVVKNTAGKMSKAELAKLAEQAAAKPPAPQSAGGREGKASGQKPAGTEEVPRTAREVQASEAVGAMLTSPGEDDDGHALVVMGQFGPQETSSTDAPSRERYDVFDPSNVLRELQRNYYDLLAVVESSRKRVNGRWVILDRAMHYQAASAASAVQKQIWAVLRDVNDVSKQAEMIGAVLKMVQERLPQKMATEFLAELQKQFKRQPIIEKQVACLPPTPKP